jgi:hypothetical protein
MQAREVTRTVVACISRLDGPVMDHLLRVRNELTAPDAAAASAKFAILYTSGWFVMWVEGSDEAVDYAVRRVALDPHNEDQKLLHRSRGRAGLRERVMVVATQTPLNPAQFSRWIAHMSDEGPSLEPVDIWQRLGAPCLIDSSTRPCRRPQQQFVLIAADDHGPVDQLREIGLKFSSPIVYQRFGLARRHSPDMGMAYVDFPVDAGAARVRVVSGRSMAQSAVRNSMPATDALVLITGNRPTAVVELSTHVADALKKLARKPQVWVAGDAPTTQACAQLLERMGLPALQAPTPEGGRMNVLGLLARVGLQLGATR